MAKFFIRGMLASMIVGIGVSYSYAESVVGNQATNKFCESQVDFLQSLAIPLAPAFYDGTEELDLFTPFESMSEQGQKAVWMASEYLLRQNEHMFKEGSYVSYDGLFKPAMEGYLDNVLPLYSATFMVMLKTCVE